MEKRELLYEGKAKRIYATEDNEIVWLSIRIQQQHLMGKRSRNYWKRALNNEITSLLF